jgi:16S rRNA (guanine1207-N2)-methyltransferase
MVSRWSSHFEVAPPMRGQYEAVPRSLAVRLVFGIGWWANSIEVLVEKLRRLGEGCARYAGVFWNATSFSQVSKNVFRTATIASMHDDSAREVLLLPFATGALAWPTEGFVRFDGARVLPGLDDARREQLRCLQVFKPYQDELERARYASAGDDVWEGYPLALVLPPRQREQSRAMLARALRGLAPGGALVACQANDDGARSMQSDLAELCGEVHAASKRHCRVAWARAEPEAQQAPLAGLWSKLDAPRQLEGWWTRPGVFAWDRIDVASALLIEHLPTDRRGRAADLGAGTGVLSAALLARNPQLEALDLFEADARALELACANLEPRANGVPIAYHLHDVSTGVPGTYDLIVSNPPFHVGRLEDVDLGRAFLAAAARALRTGGELRFVANRHLPYEAALARDFAQVREAASAHGFKVLVATKGTAR